MTAPPAPSRPTPAPAPSPRFFGWTVVGGAGLLAMCGWGLGFYGPPVFLHAIRESRGWPLGLISAAVTVHFLSGALAVANLTGFYRRWGLPATTRIGAGLLAIGVAGWGLAASPWQLFLAAILTGTGWVALGAAAVNAIVAPWFVRARPKALAMAYNGASMGGVIFSPLWVFAIGALGFPLAAALIGAAVFATAWLLASKVFTPTPESLGQAPDGDAPDLPAPSAVVSHAPALPGASLWRDRAFLSLTIGTVLALFAQVGIIAHLFSLMVPALGAGRAGIAMAMMTVAAVTGRLLVGWLMPPSANRRVVASMSYGAQIAGCLALMAAGGTAVPLIWAGVLLVGLGVGNLVSLPPLIAQAEFAPQDVQRAVGLNVAVGQAFYAFAPAAYGLLREFAHGPQDAAGAAPLIFGLTALLFAGAIVTFLAGGRRA